MPAKPPAGSPTPGDQDYDSLQDVWAEGIPYQPINDAAMQCTIVDECGKLNLNALMMNERDPNAALAAVLSALFKNLKVEEDPTDAILDWIDPDDDTRGNSGAESDYYGSFETPYACKNGPMDSIEELLLVRGITPELYFDCNMAPDERESRLGENRKPVSLPDLLTVRGHPRGKINVNTARPELLEAIVEAFSGNPGAIDAIIEAQYQAPFQSLQDFTSRAGLGGDATAMQNLIDVKSTMFRIWGDGWANDAMVRVEAVVFRAGRDILSQQPQQLAQPPRSGQNPPQQQMEMFRILDWKVIK
jgi:general secretion pathway protein K